MSTNEKKRLYRVFVEVKVEADSPREAAEFAADELELDPFGLTYMVYWGTNKFQRVDLGAPEKK